MTDYGAVYARFDRPVPEWFRGAGLGIFVHWGAYSVPAWAEPIGELGTIEEHYWFAHNPYAEWYFNTKRIPGSATQLHHEATYGTQPYDDFLEQWTADAFDPDDMLDLFRRAGARYVIPTAKHHDGITLWDAPGTGDRNTVRRGPRRDLVGDLATATRAAGLRFGVYYSGGLDWHIAPLRPIRSMADLETERPVDAAYAAYAYRQLVDLIERYSPDVLWGDIEYPDAGKPPGPGSLVDVFERFYARSPEGVVNDRWGDTHHDFRTSEYQFRSAVEGSEAWENNRGIGFSFGYNRQESDRHSLDATAALRHLADVVSRGGNLLLDVGPDATGRIPDLQRSCLQGMANWMAVNSEAVHDVAPLPVHVAAPSEEPWVRWTAGRQAAYAIIDTRGPVRLRCDPARVDVDAARRLDGFALDVRAEDDGCTVDGGGTSEIRPVVVRLPLW